MSFIEKSLQMLKLKRRVKLHESYQAIFDTLEGQQVLNHICENGLVFKSTFVAGDPYQTALNEGKRVLALSILKFVKKDHSAMLKMVEQQVNKQ